MHKLHLATSIIAIATVFGCQSAPEKKQTNEDTSKQANISSMIPPRSFYQTTIDGKQTDLFVLRNKNDVQAAVTNYGGRLVSLLVPDKQGKLVDVVLGFDSVHKYQLSTEPYFGATIGRYGNRIAKGRFKLDDKEYVLATNNGVNHLHGGKKGFQYVVWDARQIGDSLLELTYLSPDGEEGYPGNLQVKVSYFLNDNNELVLSYEASTDKKTVVNLTNHAFFNLNGQGSGTINNHLLSIYADYYTPVDSTLIPTGKMESVANTPFDFRTAATIGQRVDADHIQIKNGKGYDHNFVLNNYTSTEMKPAAKVTGDLSGITMEVFTQEPGLQFYGGNFMQSKNTIKGGTKDDFRTAFCLETQHFPDSPNQPAFPTTVVEPGKKYSTKSIYRFSITK